MPSVVRVALTVQVLGSLFFWAEASGQTKDLLIPVDDKEASSAWENHEYFLKLNTYWAKRHRLVRVDTPRLLDSERLRVALFHDTSFTVARKDLDATERGAVIAWVGEIDNPKITDQDLEGWGIPPQHRQHFSKLEIYASETSFDPASGRKYQSRQKGFTQAKHDNRGKNYYDVVATISVYGDLQNPAASQQFDLRPIDGDPELHLLVEIDPDKLIPAGPSDGA